LRATLDRQSQHLAHRRALYIHRSVILDRA
jgi:hypothetical protein